MATRTKRQQRTGSQGAAAPRTILPGGGGSSPALLPKSKNILILTEPNDAHAHAVALALSQRCANSLLWYTTDFPSRSTESLLFEADGERTTLSVLGTGDLADQSISCVWRRRPALALDPNLLHPADREFAQSECTIFRHSLLDLLLPDAFWVNPPRSALRAGRKPVQHFSARRAGLATPDTLYSNDPMEVRSFIRRHGGRVVYKTFRPYSWRNEETAWMPYTSLLTEDLPVSDELVRMTPGIYQALIPKSYELRVTVIGRRFFAAKIHSQDTVAGKLDWRMAYNELRMEPCDLPADVSRACRRLMDSLGLVFGCLDLIVTPDHEHVFLEINEMGQFLFIEEWTKLPLLDAFCEFLLQGHVDFAWMPSLATSRYSEMEREVLAMTEQAVAAHAAAPDRTVDEEKISGMS